MLIIFDSERFGVGGRREGKGCSRQPLLTRCRYELAYDIPGTNLGIQETCLDVNYLSVQDWTKPAPGVNDLSNLGMSGVVTASDDGQSR